MYRFALIALLASTVTAQSVSFSPNPAPPGAPVTVTFTDSTGQGRALSSPCTWLRIHAGSQTGPIVGPAAFCIQIIINVPANGSATFVWDQIDGNTGGLVPPGRYWFRTSSFDSNFNSQVEWYCLDVQGPNEPTMTQGSTVRVGQATNFPISSPNHPNEAFATLFSFNTNTPVALPGLIDLCLSPPLFSVFSATLDQAGQSNAFSFVVPNQPALAFQRFHLQTIIAAANPGLTLIDTNDLAITIQP